MKKRHFALLIAAAIIILILMSVSSPDAPKSANETPFMQLSEFNGPISEVITIEPIADGTSDPDGIRFLITNSSGDTHVGFSQYSLEVLSNEVWYELFPTDGVFPDVASILKEHTSQQILFPIYSHHKDLQAGRYRVIDSFLNQRTGNIEYIVAEFELP